MYRFSICVFFDCADFLYRPMRSVQRICEFAACIMNVVFHIAAVKLERNFITKISLALATVFDRAGNSDSR